MILQSQYQVESRYHLPRVLVLPTLSTLFPPERITAFWPHLHNLKLADPKFAHCAPTDLILGADVYGSLKRNGTVHGPPGTPAARLTSLGWVLMGLTDSAEDDIQPLSVFYTLTLPELGRQVERFWEQNEVDSVHIPTPDDEFCETLFETTYNRAPSGRYSVRLPIREHSLRQLGDSRNIAVHQLLSLERRLMRNGESRTKYVQFLDDYHAQGHMELVKSLGHDDTVYYLPHHAVIKPSDPSGKIRVVFNASARTTTGYALNDCLLPGPKLQQELWLVLTRWRLMRYAFTCDIVQMFRQIDIQRQDQNLQCILWRRTPDSPMLTYRLTTVTYGTTSAPYLAIRTLLQLAKDEHHNFPLGSFALENNAYVDDILTGGDTLKQAQDVQTQLIQTLGAGGFRLSKWAANEKRLCPEEGAHERLFSDTVGVSTLDLLWSAPSDTFQMRVAPVCSIERCSKRSVLSDVARLSDPLGWAAPVLVPGKILIQDCWREKLSWDESLTPVLHARWREFASTLTNLESISVPRFVGYSAENCKCGLFGFCDASERVFAAAIYIRCEIGETIGVSLLVAKNKVAPPVTNSIPRLELCGALLLARLMKAIVAGLSFVSSPLRGPPCCGYTGDRSCGSMEVCKYGVKPCRPLYARHYPRGTSILLWWQGPPWLGLPESEWPSGANPGEYLPNTVEGALQVSLSIPNPVNPNEFLTRFSTLSRLTRITALCLRFRYNTTHPGNRLIGYIRAEELATAKRRWLLLVQGEHFPSEIEALRNGQPILTSSRLLPLSPILDQEGILRVGGRLRHAAIPEETRHPVVLPRHSHYSLLLMRQSHITSQYGGPQLMRSILSEYWILHGASLA